MVGPHYTVEIEDWSSRDGNIKYTTGCARRHAHECRAWIKESLPKAEQSPTDDKVYYVYDGPEIPGLPGCNVITQITITRQYI